MEGMLAAKNDKIAGVEFILRQLFSSKLTTAKAIEQCDNSTG